MLKNWIVKVQKVSIYSTAIAYFLSFPVIAVAQINADGTLPTQVEQNGNSIEITGGAEAGNNLFHSFSEFSIPDGWEAYFNNGGNIENIINRVTGGNISILEGVLRANGFANVIILNPAGFQFNGFELNIGGGFLTTTADGLVFSDGVVFSADVNQPVNLTINVPIGIQWNGDQSDALIVVNDTTARTADDRYFTMVGGEVIVTNSQIEAPGGRVEIGGVKGAGVVEIGEDGSLVFPEEIVKANIEFQQSVVDVRSGGGGAISFNAADLLLNGSEIRAGIGESLGNPEAVAGDIRINATGLVGLNNSSFITNQVETNATGNAGNIEIITQGLEAINKSQIDTSTLGQGNGGNITINADDSVTVDGQGNVDRDGNGLTWISSDTQTEIAEGNAGSININTGFLIVVNEGEISSSAFGQGNAGNIIINANKGVKIDGQENSASLDSSVILPTTKGNGGSIEITTNSLEVVNGGQILASTFGEGNAGKIIINDANEGIKIDGQKAGYAAVASISLPESKGNGGAIEITTNSLEVVNGGHVSTTSAGVGDGGSIKINAIDNVKIDGQGILTDISSKISQGAIGRNAGKVEITTKTLEILNGAQVIVSTFGEGNAGNLTIEATEKIKLEGQSNDGFPTGILSTVETGSTGNGGNITITAKEIQIVGTDTQFNGILADVYQNATGRAGNITIQTETLEAKNAAQISASTDGAGDAGIVKVTASEIKFDGGIAREGLFTGIDTDVEEGATGNAEGVEINTNSLEIRNGAGITAKVLGTGNAGNIQINAQNIIVDGVGNNGVSNISSGVEAVEAGGNAGGIEINTNNLTVTNFGKITTTNLGKGNAGNINIQAEEITTLEGEETGIFSEVGVGAVGDGRNISIKTGTLNITQEAEINSNTAGEGNAGTVNIQATEKVFTDTGNITSAVETGAIGNAGAIEIISPQITTNNSNISTSTSGVGKAGNVTIDATSSLNLNSTQVTSTVEEGAIVETEEVGNVNLTSPNIQVENNSSLSTSTAGEGKAGNVNLNATEIVQIGGSKITSEVTSTGKGFAGAIEIVSPQITTNNSTISSSTSGVGKAGNVTIDATSSLNLNSTQVTSTVEEGAIVETEDAGNINLTSPNINLENNSSLSTSTSGVGKAGNVSLSATDILESESSQITSEVTSTGKGNAGAIEIVSPQITTNNSNISTSTSGVGKAGDVRLAATSIVQSESSQITSEVTSTGKGFAGVIEIVSPQITTNNSTISSSTSGVGKAGEVKLEATQNLTLDSTSIESAVEETGVGDAGNVNLTSPNIQVENNSSLSTSTAGEGKAGNVRLESTNIVQSESSQITSEVTSTGKGDAGAIEIVSPQITTNNSTISSSTSGVGKAGEVKLEGNEINLTNNSDISTSTTSEGSAGNINLTAEEINLNNNSQVEASTSGGKAGNIEVETNTLTLNSGGAIRTTSSSDSNAGNINLEVKESLNLEGENSGVFSETTTNSTGDGGNITVISPTVNLSNGGVMSVNSQGVGKGGKIEVTTETLNLDNGKITAQSNNASGGNINLEMSNSTFLDNNSEISATAGVSQGAGDGGNVTIKSDRYLILDGGSKITANAFAGTGGNIAITTNAFLSCASCEVEASSERGVSGNVNINTLETDTVVENQTTTQEVSTPEKIVTQNCRPGRRRRKGEGVNLVIGARGGFPPRPTDPLNAPFLLPFEIDSSVTLPLPIISEYPPVAQGLQYNEQGGISFTAVGNAGVSFPGITPPPCEE